MEQKEEKIDYEIEKIDKILADLSHKKTGLCPNFGDDIFVQYRCVEQTIERIDTLLTDLVHGGVCECCNGNCCECKLYEKKKALNRALKIIKGDWSPKHE